MRFLTPTLHRRPVVVRGDFTDPFDLFSGMTRILEPRGNGLAFRVDVRETDEAILVEAELPGVATEDVELTLDDGVLVLKGEKRASNEEKGEGFHRSERTFGRFERHIPLPSDVDEEKVSARFKAGVLEVTLPRAASVETTRRIEITSGE